MISLNGAAARLAAVGDRIIICAYAPMTEQQIESYDPNLVYLDADNNIVRTSKNIPLQLA